MDGRRPHAADADHQPAAAGDDVRHQRDVHLQRRATTGRARSPSRAASTRDRAGAVHLADDVLRPVGRASTPSRCGRPMGLATRRRRPHLDGRGRHRARRPTSPDMTSGSLDHRVHGLRRPHGHGGPRLRVPRRQRRLRGLHQPEDIHRRRAQGDDARRPHVPGPRDRRGGQRGRSPTARVFTVADTTAPETAITGQPQPTTTNTTASFTFTGQRRRHGSGRPDLRVRARRRRVRRLHVADDVHGPRRSARTRSRCARPTPPATPTSRRRATPGPSRSPADTTAPDTTITAQPPATTTADDRVVLVRRHRQRDAAGSLTFECKLDTARVRGLHVAADYTGLAVGSHTFRVRAIDAAGNIDQTPGDLHVDGPERRPSTAARSRR